MKRDYTHWSYNGIPDPEYKLAELLTSDKKLFRKTAKVVYRCRSRNCLLGFAYPIHTIPSWEPAPQFGELDNAGRLLVRFPRDFVARNGVVEPDRGEPFSPLLHSFRTEWWFFSYRHIEPVIEFYGDPDNPAESVGWMPVTNMRECRMGASEQLARIGEDLQPEELRITGERDVWEITDQAMYRWVDAHQPAVNVSHPPGYMNCEHSEVVLSYVDLVEGIGKYRGNRAIFLPR